MKFEETEVFGPGKALEYLKKSSNIQNYSEYKKYINQIVVSVYITAPLYWWKEFGVSGFSSSNIIRKLFKTPITMDCFEMGDYCSDLNYSDIPNHSINDTWIELIRILETLRLRFIETNDKKYLKELIRILPESWLQKTHVIVPYEKIHNMEKVHENSKLSEWSVEFKEWASYLPYIKKFNLYNQNLYEE